MQLPGTVQYGGGSNKEDTEQNLYRQELVKISTKPAFLLESIFRKTLGWTSSWILLKIQKDSEGWLCGWRKCKGRGKGDNVGSGRRSSKRVKMS